MYKIKAGVLDADRFAKYGVFQNLFDDEDCKKKAPPVSPEFFADLLKLDFGREALPTASICIAKKSENNIIKFIEGHRHTAEALLPLDGDVTIYTGAAEVNPEKYKVQNLEAFIVPAGTLIVLNALILHGCQFSREKNDVHVLCLLPERTFANDCVIRHLADGEQAEII